MCEAGEQEERTQQEAGEQKGGAETFVTVRVTASRGAEQGYRRSAATTRTKQDGRRNSRVGGCRKMITRGEGEGRWVRRRFRGSCTYHADLG